MSIEPERPLWKAMRIASENGPEKDFLEQAHAAKEEIIDGWMLLARESMILDSLVARVAPTAEWVDGVVGDERGGTGRPSVSSLQPQPTAPTKIATPDRAKRALNIALLLIASGETRISTKAIAETLQAEGFHGSLRDLSVSVGNTLHHAGDWQRVGPGEYERTD